MSAPNPDWSGPQWNAWVAAGDTRDERIKRLELVPDGLRADVERHVKTVFAIRKFYERKANAKQ